MPDVFKNLEQSSFTCTNSVHTDPAIHGCNKIVELNKKIKQIVNSSPSKGSGSVAMSCIQSSGISGRDCLKVANLIRIARRSRVQGRPEDPDPNGSSNFPLDNHFLLESFPKLRLHEVFLDKGRPSCVRHIIFFIPDQLNVLATRLTVAVDATFKLVKKPLYTQLFTLNGFVKSKEGKTFLDTITFLHTNLS